MNQGLRFQQMAGLCCACTKFLQEAGRDTLDEILSRREGSNPRIVVAEALWHHLREMGFPMEGFELAYGTMNSQDHAWFERRIVDKVADPLPMRWIVDPAPVDVMVPVLPLGPNSPFLMLYKRRSQNE